jgi:hypothetical protein
MMDKPHNPDFVNAANMPGERLDNALLEQLAALPKSIAPQNDPWLQIAARIEHERAGSSGSHGQNSRNATFGRGWLALAASLLLVLTSLALLKPSSDSPAAGGQPQVAAKEQHPLLNEQGARVPATAIEREYQAAFREFVAMELSQGPAGLAAGTEIRQAGLQQAGLQKAEFQKDWALMQRVEAELLVALELEPQNPWLLQRLMHLRSRQLQLLHAIADSGHRPQGNPI